MSELFVATDPRGYEVVCDQELWDKKVLVKHPIMKGTEKEVKRAIEKPDYGLIYQDAHRPDRCVYYRLRRNRKQYVKVVVEFNQENEGRVVTAFLTSSPKTGEKLIWPASSL